MNLKKIFIFMMVGICLFQLPVANAKNNSAKNIQTKITTEKIEKSMINSIRFSKASDKVRVVFDINADTKYDVKQQPNGDIMVDFSEPINKQYLSGINVNDDTVPFLEVYSDDKTSCVVIKVTDNSAFDMGELNNPRRLYIDVQKDYEYSITKKLEPGLTQISYYSKKSGVKQHAQLVEVSPKYFKFVPVLGGGDKMAKNTVSAMSDYVNAAVAENASYFGSGKDLYGVTKIAGDLVSSMYLTRTGFGVLADGTPYIGDVSYSGIVQSKNGDVYVSGLNGTRTSDSVMLYNQYYGKSTGTDNSGIEYVVKDNKIVKINSGNSLLRPGEIVVSATGNGKNTDLKLHVHKFGRLHARTVNAHEHDGEDAGEQHGPAQGETLLVEDLADGALRALLNDGGGENHDRAKQQHGPVIPRQRQRLEHGARPQLRQVQVGHGF